MPSRERKGHQFPLKSGRGSFARRRPLRDPPTAFGLSRERGDSSALMLAICCIGPKVTVNRSRFSCDAVSQSTRCRWNSQTCHAPFPGRAPTTPTSAGHAPSPRPHGEAAQRASQESCATVRIDRHSRLCRTGLLRRARPTRAASRSQQAVGITPHRDDVRKQRFTPLSDRVRMVELGGAHSSGSDRSRCPQCRFTRRHPRLTQRRVVSRDGDGLWNPARAGIISVITELVVP